MESTGIRRQETERRMQCVSTLPTASCRLSPVSFVFFVSLCLCEEKYFCETLRNFVCSVRGKATEKCQVDTYGGLMAFIFYRTIIPTEYLYKDIILTFYFEKSHPYCQKLLIGID